MGSRPTFTTPSGDARGAADDPLRGQVSGRPGHAEPLPRRERWTPAAVRGRERGRDGRRSRRSGHGWLAGIVAPRGARRRGEVAPGLNTPRARSPTARSPGEAEGRWTRHQARRAGLRRLRGHAGDGRAPARGRTRTGRSSPSADARAEVLVSRGEDRHDLTLPSTPQRPDAEVLTVRREWALPADRHLRRQLARPASRADAGPTMAETGGAWTASRFDQLLSGGPCQRARPYSEIRPRLLAGRRHRAPQTRRGRSEFATSAPTPRCRGAVHDLGLTAAEATMDRRRELRPPVAP